MSGTRTEQPVADAEARALQDLREQLAAEQRARAEAEAKVSTTEASAKAALERAAAAEQRAYETERDTLISDAVANNAMTPGEAAGWKKDCDDLRAAGVHQVAFNRIKALPRGKALRTGSTGRAADASDQDGIDDEPQAETAADLRAEIDAEVKASGNTIDFKTAAMRVHNRNPDRFDAALRNNPSADDRRAAR